METYTEFMTDGTVTLACVIVWTNGKKYHAHGNSRRMPEDKYDRNLGDSLAANRAMKTIMSNIDRDLDNKVKNLESKGDK